MSYAAPKIFTKDEATAAQRTFLFHLTNTADGSDATAKTLAGADVRLSKAGAALANATGAVTELADGWYKLVLSAADVDTIGALAVDISESGCDDVHVEHQVVLFDINVATAPLASDAIGSSQVAASAVAELQSGLATAAQVAAIELATRSYSLALGTIETDGAVNTEGKLVAVSTQDAIDVTFQASGTFDSATLTIETTQNPNAESPVWTAYDDDTGPNPLTSAGSVVVVGGGHLAARARVSNDGASTAIVVSAVIRKPA